MKPIKKTVFLLDVDGYAPEITELTYPLIRHYARKIGAEIYKITERKFLGWPPVYEKLQIKTIAKEIGCDWAIYVDSDALIHPDFVDITHFLKKDTVCHWGNDNASMRWRHDEYFLRDGREIASCNWFTMASDWCLDLWTPLDITFEEAKSRIFPTVDEINTVIEPGHLIDDYTLSRNIAKFGLHFKNMRTIFEEHKITGSGMMLWHQYTIPVEQKVREMNKVLHEWRVK